ncbi:tRNA lysidine(34) synthetase TilS [Vibrio salinus]|uniref:tRNA lysidine(34) synthetase TilS n=1 Tax=Vibrio salinus TaxID=2899784 RepID=UPI001E3B02DE|nr:tRNA lysidine(34) synthetase TilS [Vibrio salinus]MCE0494399.1 tRNA lysidine(34) synthetase TilS [Vibrio salinus]
MDLVESFNQTLHQYLKSKSRIVLALSGGIDSRVMLQLLHEFALIHPMYPVLAVHVHHGISPNADQWAKMCQIWCHEVDIPFHLEKVRLGDCRGKSLEQMARTARYEALKHYIGSDDLLLTAQHGDDQLETFLLALKRGSGPKGLSGMAECQSFDNGVLVRPFLNCTRQQIETYANYHQLEWVNDESNDDIRYERNFIRHKITPILDSRWPHIRSSVQRSAEHCARQEQLIEYLLADELCRLMGDKDSLEIDALTKKPEIVRSQLLRLWLSSLQVLMPSKKHLQMIWSEVALAKVDANPVLRMENKQIRRFNGRLHCLDIYTDISEWTSDLHIGCPVVLPDGLGRLTLKPVVEVGRLNSKILNGSLRVVFNPEGVMATPEKRHGKKTLKYWFQEYGVPSWLRRRTPILMSGNEVVSVAGLFVCRAYAGDEFELVWENTD